MTLTASPNPVLIGGTLTYTAILTNNGPFETSGAFLVDTIPVGLNFQGLTTSRGGADSFVTDGTKVTANFGTIASGEQVSVFLTFTPTAAGLVSNTVAVSDTVDLDQNSDNNSATISVPVSPTDLSVVIVPPADPLGLNVPATYTIRVTNNGADAAPNVVFYDVLGSIAAFAGATASQGSYSTNGNTLTADLGSIAAGQTVTLTILANPFVSGALTNSVGVVTSGYDPDLTNNAVSTINQVSPADLAVSASASASPVLLGQPVIYTVTVTNNGPANAINVLLRDALPAGVTVTDVVLSQGTYSGTGTLVANLGNLASGASATLTITAIPGATGTFINTASVTSDNFDVNPVNDVAMAGANVFNQPGTIDLTSSYEAVTETSGLVNFTVVRTQGSQGQVSVQYTTANLTAVAGVNYIPGISTTLIFADGETSKTISIPIIHDFLITPNLNFLLTLSDPTGGAILGANSAAVVTILNTDRDTVAPTVLGVQPIVAGNQINGFVVTFSEAMDQARAELIDNYFLSISGRDPGRGAGNPITITGATYDPIAHTVTLTTSGNLSANRFYFLNLNGTIGQALTDLSGNVLDGNFNGAAFGNYSTTIGTGKKLTYLDANNNVVTITLKRGGTMTIIRDASGNALSIALSGIVPRRSILDGSVRRTPQTTSRRVMIGIISGFQKFGDVRSNLTTAPFFATFAPVQVNGTVIANSVTRSAVRSKVVPAGPSSF